MIDFVNLFVDANIFAYSHIQDVAANKEAVRIVVLLRRNVCVRNLTDNVTQTSVQAVAQFIITE
jgi:hypothetical protein